MASKQQTPKYGLAIDWETSGVTRELGSDSSKVYQGISLGAIVFNTEDFSPVEELYREVQFNNEKWKWSSEAEAIHGLSQEYLNEHGVSQEEAAIDLASLILKYWGSDSRVMFLGHNPAFDIRFTNQLLNQIEIEFAQQKQTAFDSWIQLHHVVLDTSALGFIAFGLYKSDLLFEKIGFADRGKHNALDDIRQTLETCAVVKQLVGVGLNG